MFVAIILILSYFSGALAMLSLCGHVAAKKTYCTDNFWDNRNFWQDWATPFAVFWPLLILIAFPVSMVLGFIWVGKKTFQSSYKRSELAVRRAKELERK